MKLEERLLALRNRWDDFTVFPMFNGFFEISNESFEGYNADYPLTINGKTIEEAIDGVEKILNCKHPNAVNEEKMDKTFYRFVCPDCGHIWCGSLWIDRFCSWKSDPKTIEEAFQRGIFKEKTK